MGSLVARSHPRVRRRRPVRHTRPRGRAIFTAAAAPVVVVVARPLWTQGAPYGRLVINGVDLHGYAWQVLDPRPLWMPQSYRGANVTIPGVSGRRAQPYRVDETNFSLPMFLTGDRDRFGQANTNRFTGLETNIAYLKAGLLVPPAAPNTSYSATLTMPSGSVLTANVQVRGLDLGDPADALHPRVFKAVLHLTVPAGQFT